MPTRRARVDVKGLRQTHGLTQEKLAQHVWGDKSLDRKSHAVRTISRWENGHTKPGPMAESHLRRLKRELEAAHHDGSTEGPPHLPTRRPLASSTDAPADAPPASPPRPARPGRSGGLLPSVR